MHTTRCRAPCRVLTASSLPVAAMTRASAFAGEAELRRSRDDTLAARPSRPCVIDWRDTCGPEAGRSSSRSAFSSERAGSSLDRRGQRYRVFRVTEARRPMTYAVGSRGRRRRDGRSGMAGLRGLVEAAPRALRLDSTFVRYAALALAVLVVVGGVLATRADAFIYWGNDDPSGLGIGRADNVGTNADNNFISTERAPVAIAVDSVYIYWAEAGSGAIGRAFLNGSSVNPDWLPVGGQPAGLAVDGRHIYWTNVGDAGQSTIGRADIDGSSVDDSFITGATFDTGEPQGVAVDKTRTHIYWGNGTAATVGRANLDQNGDVSQIDQSFV